jgi:hypothetical protein
LKIESVDTTNLSKNKKKVLPEMVNKIFAICKNDPNFHLKNKIEDIEKVLEGVNLRLKKQNSLLENANSIEKDLSKKISILDNNIYDMKSKLLESLGSEI